MTGSARERVFVAGFALFTAASAACGLAPNIGALIAARAIQGVGAAVLVPCSLILLSHAYHDPGERSRAIGSGRPARRRRSRPARWSAAC